MFRNALLAIVLIAGLSSASRAEQFTAKYHGREVVVHTNPVPVVLHRLVPPNVGRHVTINEYRNRKAPRLNSNR